MPHRTGRRAARAVVVLAVVALAMVARAGPAVACTCGRHGIGSERPLSSGIAQADGAVVATYVGGQTFAVERVVKGPIGTTVRVDFSRNAGGCGFSPAIGGRMGMLLRRDERDQWGTSACSLVDPDVLLASARRSPPPSRLPENLAAAGVLSLLASAVVLVIEARTRHDPASPKLAGS